MLKNLSQILVQSLFMNRTLPKMSPTRQSKLQELKAEKVYKNLQLV